jgi:hypothetical protein
MYVLATCTASIYRGSNLDDYGDLKPDNGPAGRVATNVIASIVERDSHMWDQATTSPRVVRVVEGRVPSTVDVRVEDRVRDDTHGEWFWVENVTRPRTAGKVPDTVLDLRRIN